MFAWRPNRSLILGDIVPSDSEAFHLTHVKPHVCCRFNTPSRDCNQGWQDEVGGWSMDQRRGAYRGNAWTAGRAAMRSSQPAIAGVASELHASGMTRGSAGAIEYHLMSASE